jgi:hypothetical protein
MGFQALWIGLRSTFFHIIEDRERPILASLRGKPWKDASLPERMRVQNLVFAVAKYQSHVHPRGPWSYVEDMEKLQGLHNVVAQYPLATEETCIDIKVAGVIGDTLLSSASWVLGSKSGGFDFYDTCIVILNIKGEEICIPSARVLSSTAKRAPKDPEEASEIERPAQGTSNTGSEIEWFFWIPCGNGRWLYFHSEGLKFKGARKAQVLTDVQVTNSLEAGDLFISLKHVDEVRAIVEISKKGCTYISELLS